MLTRGMHPFGAYRPLRKKILIVDDDANVQKIIARLMTQGGYHFEIASDGFETGVKVMGLKPGLVILDLIMPGMDAFEVCRRIKNNPSTAHIKILAVTRYDTPENRTRIMAAGADRYMAKPFDLKTLLNHVDSLLEETKAIKVQK
ncbi:MAG: response regulator [Desulfatirhabdiaceae bacterium]